MNESATASSFQLDVLGMHCAGCVSAVESALRRVPGVASVSVNLASERAVVSSTGTIAAETLIAALRSAGYDGLPASDAGDAIEQRQRRRSAALADQRRRLLLALLLGLPVMILHMSAHGAHAAWVWWTQGLLTAAVIAVAAGPLLLGAARALRGGSGNMDLLVSLGALVAFGSGVVGIAIHAPALILFDSAAMIVLFVSLGKYLEARARGRASAALETLLSRLPRRALRLADGQPEEIAVDEVRVGDLLRVAAHSTVPVDGEIASGHLTVDESMLTGESLPVERGVGQPVLGGTQVQAGLADVRAVATGRTSAATRIARLVEQAQATRPPWQRLADRAAAVFVPGVLALSVLTFTGWWLAGSHDAIVALERAIAVLVVACPCAMGLAIPTAVLVGTTCAAQRGILVRDPGALEAVGEVREILLDKTGTLTIGRPTLQTVVLLAADSDRPPATAALSDPAAQHTIRLAASLERVSQHPLATALVAAAQRSGLTLADPRRFHSEPGAGLRGRIDGVRVGVGTAGWLDANGVATERYAATADALAAQGASVVWVAQSGKSTALLAFTDPPHPDSAAALSELRALGVRTRILSGDRHAAVAILADRLSAGGFEAELRPADKLERVRAASADGQPVAMVGDGVNDAPALAAATVGIAIGAGADVARESADICLVGHSPRLIPAAIRIARSTTRIMKQNLFWAFAYNLIMLPAAVFSSISPGWATAAMMLSSLTVIGNSLRLRRLA